MNKKRGNVTTTLTLTISLLFLIVLTIYIINMITPFIWYQKLENIANKYIYVIEKYGYLTDKEENNMYRDLKDEGFNIDFVKVDFPRQPLNYGTLFKFEISYTVYQKYNIISQGIKEESRKIPLSIKKYSYSKM